MQTSVQVRRTEMVFYRCLYVVALRVKKSE